MLRRLLSCSGPEGCRVYGFRAYQHPPQGPVDKVLMALNSGYLGYIKRYLGGLGSEEAQLLRLRISGMKAFSQSTARILQSQPRNKQRLGVMVYIRVLGV